MKLFKTDFAQGLVWNYISIIFLAIGGVTFSFLIGIYYDAETLGNFNLIYAYYIVLSQIGVWGSHMAVTKYVSEYAGDREKVNIVLSCAILMVCFFSVGLGSLVWVLCNSIFYKILGNVLLSSVPSIIVAVFFFAVNKVVLGYLNGLSRMREYAVFQTSRNIFIVMWIVIFALRGVSGDKISLCFTYTEIIIFILGMFLIIVKGKFRFRISIEWLKKIFIFGTHIMPANIVLELSTKVDILCLSWVLNSEKTVGIYSFAALFSEGFYQLLVVIRRSINPLITQKYVKNELTEFYEKIIYMVRRRGYLLGVVSALFVILGYRILCFLINDANYYMGTVPLIIILFAIICNMKGIVLGNILSQTGNPTAESVNNVITVMANFIFNILFIIKWGMIGAALATGLSYFVFSANQNILIRKKFNLN